MNPSKYLALFQGKKNIAFFSVLVLLLVLVPVSIVVNTSDFAQKLSLFSQGTLNSQTAATLWKPTPSNPARTALDATYTSRLDSIVVLILRKGQALTSSQFNTYLDRLIVGIDGLGKKDSYKADPTVRNIISYIVYELQEAKNALASSTSTVTASSVNWSNKESIKTFIQANPDISVLAGSILVKNADPSIIADAMKELGYMIDAQEIVDYISVNKLILLSDASGSLAVNGVRPSSGQIDYFLSQHSAQSNSTQTSNNSNSNNSSGQSATGIVTNTAGSTSTTPQTQTLAVEKIRTEVSGSVFADCYSWGLLQQNASENTNILGLVQTANSYGNLDFMYCTVPDSAGRPSKPHFYTKKENRTCLPSGDNACYEVKNVTAASGPTCSPGKEIEYYFYYNPGLQAALNGNSPIDHWNNYGLAEGRRSCWTGKIDANGQSIVNQPTESPQIISNNTRGKTTFGIFYSAWHCPIVKHPALPILYTSDLSQNYKDQFHFWGKPQLGHYCLTDREDVLRQHAAWLKDAGIEYIVFDSTNHAFTDSRSDRSSEMVIEPFKKLLAVWSTIPGAPKVVPWVPVVQGGDMYSTLRGILDGYPNMKFDYKGKPLFLATGDTSRFTTDLVAMSQLEQSYTVRTMWGLQRTGSPTNWSFLERNGENGVRNGEQITVSAAYQETHITESTGVGKNNGETFKTQFSTVFANPGVDTVLISSWNEWMGQKFIINGKITYTDSFDEDKNRDIEPQDGGKGSFYYDLMKRCISAYKSGANSCQ